MKRNVLLTLVLSGVILSTGCKDDAMAATDAGADGGSGGHDAGPRPDSGPGAIDAGQPPSMQRALFVLRDKRQTVRNAVFERENLILILRKISRICHEQIFVDLSADGQTRRRIKPLTGNNRVDFKTIQTEKFVGRFAQRVVN